MEVLNLLICFTDKIISEIVKTGFFSLDSDSEISSRTESSQILGGPSLMFLCFIYI